MKTIQDAENSDSTVCNMRHGGASLESIIVQLVKEKKAMFEELLKLQSIVPRKIKAPDGKVYVWHCPSELIPLTP